jgi:hypothetical protein
MSALPPAPNATTTRTGLVGHSSARADASVSMPNASATAALRMDTRSLRMTDEDAMRFMQR